MYTRSGMVFCIGLSLLLSMPAPGAAEIEVQVDTQAKPWTHLDFRNDPDEFQFAVVSDNAGGPRWGIFSEAVAKLNLLRPEFVMGLGDCVEGYEDSREQIERQWEQFMGYIAELEPPFFFVAGNHDVGRPLWSEVYRGRFGREYYHFVYKDVLFLCLLTNDLQEKNTGIGEEQIAYAEHVLKEHQDVRWTMVFQHKPLWEDKGAQGWDKIAELLKGRNCTVFTGHTHEYMYREQDGVSFVTLSTTGGGNPLRGAAYGELDQIAWVTMTDEGPRIANLALDGIMDKTLRTPETAGQHAPFRKGQAVTATPIVLDASELTEASTRLTIANPSDSPMRVKILFEPSAGVLVSPASVAAVVPGGSKHEVELRLTAKIPVPLAELQPLVMHWKANYDNEENLPSLELAGQTVLAVDGPMTIPTRENPVTVDGRLDDWTALPIAMDQPANIYVNTQGWKGPEDCRVRFATCHDEEYLYVAVKSIDDEPCFDGWKYWEDFAMVWVDARGSATDDPRTSVFAAITGPEMSREQAEEYQEGNVPEGLTSAATATDDGFEAEFAIPIAYLNERQNGEWKHVRLNVSVGDFDKRDSRDGSTILSWRPQWFQTGDHPASGVFTRE